MYYFNDIYIRRNPEKTKNKDDETKIKRETSDCANVPLALHAA